MEKHIYKHHFTRQNFNKMIRLGEFNNVDEISLCHSKYDRTVNHRDNVVKLAKDKNFRIPIVKKNIINYKKLTDEDRKEVIKMLKNGESNLNIERKTGISRPTINKIKKNNNIKVNSKNAKRLTNQEKKLIIDLLKRGYGPSRIQRETGIHRNTVSKIKKQIKSDK